MNATTMTSKDRPITEDQIKVLELAEEHPDKTPKELAGLLDDDALGPDYVDRVTRDFELPPDHDTDDSGDSEPPSPGDVTIEYKCALCDNVAETLAGARTHVTKSKDPAHRDRHGSEPGVVEVIGDDYLAELNGRAEDGVITDTAWEAIWGIVQNPDMSQYDLAEETGMDRITLIDNLNRAGIDWASRHRDLYEIFRDMPINPMTDYDFDFAGDDEEEVEDDVEEETTIEAGNASYTGPATGLNEAEREQTIDERPVKSTKDIDPPENVIWDNSVDPLPIEEALEEFDEMTDMQQAIVIAALVVRNDHYETGRFAGTSNGYPRTFLDDDERGETRHRILEGLDAVNVSPQALYDRARPLTHDHSLESLEGVEDEPLVDEDALEEEVEELEAELEAEAEDDGLMQTTSLGEPLAADGSEEPTASTGLGDPDVETDWNAVFAGQHDSDEPDLLDKIQTEARRAAADEAASAGVEIDQDSMGELADRIEGRVASALETFVDELDESVPTPDGVDDDADVVVGLTDEQARSLIVSGATPESVKDRVWDAVRR